MKHDKEMDRAHAVCQGMMKNKMKMARSGMPPKKMPPKKMPRGGMQA